jgi:hypothetical protein
MLITRGPNPGGHNKNGLSYRYHLLSGGSNSFEHLYISSSIVFQLG